jgi:small-conductance mechanosensitive channel
MKMSTEQVQGNTSRGGGCCGGKGAGQTLAQLEQELQALWAQIQQERARQTQATQASTTETAKKKSCCCG